MSEEPHNQKFYIELESDMQKISSMHNLDEILKPLKLCIIVKNVENKPEEVRRGLAEC